MLKNVILLTILFCASQFMLAQDTQQEHKDEFNDEEVIAKSIDRHPNSKHFSHLYVGYGFVLGEQSKKGSDIIYGKSHSFDLGWLYKYKISERFNIGVDVYYNYQVFHLKQDSSKTLPNNFLHHKEKLIVNQMNGDAFLRIRLKRSPMLMGKFIDLGAYGGYVVNAKMIVVDKLQTVNAYGSKETETIHNKLNFIEPLQYGAFARFGLGHFVFTFRYRLTDLFKKSYNFTEMPVYNVGIRFGFHD